MPWQPLQLGRYVLHDPIAAGGMASVHLARLRGPHGFARTVAIKRLLPHLSEDAELVRMFRREATLAGRIQHPNVVVPIDVVAEGPELYLVMDYIDGEALSQLLEAAPKPIPLSIATAVVLGVLYGLDSAHQARGEDGQSLGLVHRDVSPQNILLGADGGVRVVDFGIAKVSSRARATLGNGAFGKLGYMAPEQLNRQAVDHRADLWAVGVVFFELLSGARLFEARDPAVAMEAILASRRPPLERLDLPPELPALIERALAVEPAHRFPSARAMARAIEQLLRPASPSELGDWVERHAGERLDLRRRRVLAIEQHDAEQAGTPALHPAVSVPLQVSPNAPTERAPEPAAPGPDPVLRSQATYAFAQRALERGHADLLQTYDVRIEQGPELRLPLSKIRAFAAALAERERAPNLGLELGIGAPTGVYGLFEYVVRSAPSLGSAAERLVRYQALTDPSIRFGLERRGELGVLRHSIPDQPLALGRQGNEFVLAVLARIFREASQGASVLAEVGLAHAAPEDTTLHQRFFDCPLRWNQGENSIALTATSLDLPLQVQDSRLAQVLVEEAEARLLRLSASGSEPDPWLRALRDALVQALRAGPPRPGDLARTLGTRPAQLHLELKTRGLSFSDYVDQVRRSLAEQAFAAPGRSVAEVAYLLGFADLGEFVSAYQRWTGRPPPDSSLGPGPEQ